MPEPATWLAALRAGRIDYIGANVRTSLEWFDEAASLLRDHPELQAHRHYVRSDQAFAMYVPDPPFDDIRVRRAMQMALDNETIAAAVYQGQALTTPQGVIGRSQPAYVVPYEQWPQELQHAYRYDPEAAEALLDEAGYPRGADGIRLTVPLQWPAWDEIGAYQHMALEYWRAVGVQVEVHTVPGRRWIALLGAGRLYGLSPAVLGTSVRSARRPAVAGAGAPVEPRPRRRPGVQRVGSRGPRRGHARGSQGGGPPGRLPADRAALVHLGPERSLLQRHPALGTGVCRRHLPRPRADQRRVRAPLDRPPLTSAATPRHP